jgi:hypothetical protein
MGAFVDDTLAVTVTAAAAAAAGADGAEQKYAERRSLSFRSLQLMSTHVHADYKLK